MTTEQATSTDVRFFDLHPPAEALKTWKGFVAQQEVPLARMHRLPGISAPIDARPFQAEFFVSKSKVEALFAALRSVQDNPGTRIHQPKRWDHETFMQRALEDRFPPGFEREIERGWQS